MANRHSFADRSAFVFTSSERLVTYRECFCACACCVVTMQSHRLLKRSKQHSGTEQKKGVKCASTLILKIDRCDFSDSLCCFQNVTISLMLVVMSTVMILDVTTVSVTSKHEFHHVFVFTPLLFSPCDVLHPTSQSM